MPVSAAPPRREDPSRIALEYARRFGAPPRSVLEALYALDQAHRAPEVFAALKEPSVHDLHGMARCLIDLKRPREAHTLLETHWDGVTPDAGLALLDAALEMDDLAAAGRAWTRLRDLEVEGETRVRRALSEAALRRTQGGMRQARRILEGMQAALPTRPDRRLHTAVHTAWGELLLGEGDALRAQDHLLQALEGAVAAEVPRLRWGVVQALLVQGRLAEAQGAALYLEALEGATPRFARLAAGLLALASGELATAQARLTEAVRDAAQQGARVLELRALRALAPLDAALKRTSSKRSLLRAETLAQNPLEVLRVRLTAQLTLPEAERGAVLLERLSREFEALAAWPEALEARYAQCSALHAQGTGAGDLEGSLASVRVLLARRPRLRPLGGVWALCPQFEGYARTHLAQALPQAEPTLEVRSLGEEALTLGAQALSIPMRRFHELVVYLLLRGEASLTEILRDVFEDEPIQRARNYLHQMRHLLGLSSAQVRIGFDRQRKVYRLEREVEVFWDLELVRAGLLERGGRAFMPGCGSAWVETAGE